MKTISKYISLTCLLTSTLCSANLHADTAPNSQAQKLAFTHIGYYMAFQYGLVYAKQYGQQISKYDEFNLLPTLGNFGANTMVRLSGGYNLNQNIAFEASFNDNGVSTQHRRSNYAATGVTIQNYAFNIYNLELTAVLKNSFKNAHTNIYTKFGLAYSYGVLDIDYNTTSFPGPTWNNLGKNYHNSFTASGIVPIWDVGIAWSANRYLALTLDYERSFNTIVGKGQFNDIKQSTLQPLNMFLVGANYTF